MTTYKVVAETGYDGRQPGEEFDADLDPDAEERALLRGSIEIVKGSPARKRKEDSNA